MGYTNYWKRTDKEYDESFVDLVKDVFSSCKQKGITLRDGFGEGEPVADLTDIWFNGDGSKGLDHETFLIPNTSSENFESGFNFCKTAAKPYDYAVKEVLRLAEKYGYVTDVSDDGEVDVISDAEYLGESYKRESVDGKQTLADWISNPRNQRRYGNDEIMVVCLNPYLDEPDDCPGVLFDGTFDELKNGTGDNYISDNYDSWVVTGSTYKRYGGTDFLEISVDSIH